MAIKILKSYTFKQYKKIQDFLDKMITMQISNHTKKDFWLKMAH